MVLTPNDAAPTSRTQPSPQPSQRPRPRVLVLQDLFLPIGSLVGLLVRGCLSILSLDVDDHSDAHRARRIGEFLSVATFAPLLTAAFFVLRHRTRRAYRRAIGIRAQRKWVHFAKRNDDGASELAGLLDFAKMQMVVKQAVMQEHGVSPLRSDPPRSQSQPKPTEPSGVTTSGVSPTLHAGTDGTRGASPPTVKRTTPALRATPDGAPEPPELRQRTAADPSEYDA